MRTFRWLSTHDIPAEIDLRQCGWSLVDDPAGAARIGLAHVGRMDARDWVVLLNPPPPWKRRSIVLAGVDDAGERARLIRLGLGEVLPCTVTLGELEARAARVAEQSTWLPPTRRVGPLELDLRLRDARAQGRALGLHPREFALLWRLADQPGRPVSKRALLSDVWQLGFVPETNSLAVHVFRVRAKLARDGLAGMVRTDPDGGYALDLPGDAPPRITAPGEPAVNMRDEDEPSTA